MDFFRRLFGGQPDLKPQPNIKVGRYSDAYKTRTQYDAWDLCLEQFEKGDYLDAYETFFTYLRDEKESNIQVWREQHKLRFELLQGSKKIRGFADTNTVRVETKVANVDVSNVGFMRRLIELNFNLKYSRYALDDDSDIVMVFDTYTLDGSPYKLYYALKEVATNSDKQDDLLVDEFESLHLPDKTLIQDIPLLEKKIKYNFIQQKIQTVFDEIDNSRLDATQYPGGVAYLWLNLTYMLDFLTKPEGYMMEVLERMHRLYFANDGKSTIQKNQLFRKEFTKLQSRPKEEFFKELYNVTSTFGITSPVNHDRVISFIDGELHNMDWYKENGHDAIALSISGYIVGYCLFYYAIPKPDKDLFYLYYQIVENDYFKALGFSHNFYNKVTKKLNKKAIKQAIEYIEESNEAEYVRLNANTNILRFDSLANFAQSFLLMVKQLDMTKRA